MKGQTEKSGIDKLNQMRCENHMQKSVLVLNNAACYWKTIGRWDVMLTAPEEPIIESNICFLFWSWQVGQSVSQWHSSLSCLEDVRLVKIKSRERKTLTRTGHETLWQRYNRNSKNSDLLATYPQQPFSSYFNPKQQRSEQCVPIKM